ncbi:MAG TPA: hypothetical protein VH914_01770 [Acidimicrobiia bacterium]|nr:hypothetical protein [Acidimicrobiia bacterium]
MEVGVVDGARVRARGFGAGVGENLVFDVEEFTRRVAPTGDTATLYRTERNETRVEHEVVGEPLDLGDGATVAELVADTLQHLEPAERRTFRSETTRGCAQRNGDGRDGRADTTGGLIGGCSGETFGQLSRGEPGRDRFGRPTRPQVGVVFTDDLRRPRRERRDLRGTRGPAAFAGEFGDDRGAPFREQTPQRFGDAGELADTAADRTPIGTEPLGELVPELCLVEVTGGLGVGEDPAAIERPPDTVIRCRGAVRHDHMRVQERVAFAARAMHERRSQEPATRSRREAVVAATDRAGLTLEEPDRSSDRSGVRADDLRRDIGWGERPRDRDRFRCPERQIEPADATIVRDAEPGTVAWVPVVENRGQVRSRDVAGESEQRR